MLPPRGNQPGATVASFETVYKPDDNGGSASPNVYVAGATYCAATSGDTGDVCEVDTPSPTGSATASRTLYQYDGYGEKTSMTTPDANALTAAQQASSGCAATPAGVPACSTIYTYYPDGSFDLSGNTPAGGWLRGVTDPYGHFVAYGYDAAGNVARTWDRDATAAAGQPLASYPGTLAAPTSCTYTETLYQGGGTAGVAAPCSSSTPVSALADPWRYLRSKRDPLGNLTTYGVDANGNQTSITPPRGNVAGNTTNYTTTQTFDNNDNRLTETLPVGSSDGTVAATATWTYDMFNNPATMLDARSHLTAYVYDPVNRLTATRWTRGSNLAKGTYPATCGPVTSDPVFPNGSDVCSTTTGYDGEDNVVATQDANLQTTTYGYDAVGREVTTSVPGNVNGANTTVMLRTDTDYDADGDITDVCPPREFDATQAASAAAVAATNHTAALCSPAGIYSSHDTYNDADNVVTTTTYRSDGVAKASNQAVTTSYGYDADGNTIQTTNPDGTAAGALPDSYTVFTGYDILDREICQFTPRQAGSTPTGACAAVPAALTAAVDYDTTTWNYDPSGDVINEIMPPGSAAEGGAARVSAWRYDADHRVIDTVTGATMADGQSFGPGDDAGDAGSPGPSGATNVRTSAVYDPDGNVITVYSPRAFTPGAVMGSFMETIVYDADDRPVTDSVPRYDTATDGTVGSSPTQADQCPTGAAGYPASTGVCTTTAGYDATGNVTKLTLPTATDAADSHAANRYLTIAWTDDNLRASVNAPDPSNDGGRASAETDLYDGDGQPISTSDAAGDTTVTNYTPNELVASTNGPDYGTVTPQTKFGYDANGNQTTVTDGQTNVAKTVYSADNLVADAIDGAGDDTAYSYDPTGNPVTVTSPSAVAKDATNPVGAATTNTYTLDNLLASTTTPDTIAGTPPAVTTWRQTVYGYDPAGRKTAQQTTTATTASPLPALETCGSADVECFTYDPDDRSSGQQGRGGVDTITTSYDADGDTTATTDTSTGPNAYTNTVTSTFYLDDLPRRVDDGTQTTSYSYDANGQTAARVQAGDGVGGATHSTEYLYDDADLPVAAASDQVTGNANPATGTRWTWAYDQVGRPVTQVDPNGQTETTAYNADSTVAGKTVAAPGGATLANWTYQYNNDQQITTQNLTTETGAAGSTGTCNSAATTGPCTGTDTYSYDAAERLLSYTDATNTAHAVGYDHDGNRTSYGTVHQTYNADDTGNQTTTAAGTQTDSYNSLGDLHSDGCNTYSYDGFDRTTKIADPGGGTCGAASTVTDTYDGLDRQTSHADSTPLGPVATDIDYDGATNTVASETPLGVTSLIATGYTLTATGTPIAETALAGIAGTQFLAADGTNDITLTTTDNTTSTVACTARFDPYGNPTNPQTGDPQHVCDTGTTPSDLFYNTARHDATSGTYQYGARTYDPTKDTFLTPDSYRAAPPTANQSVGTDPLTRDTYTYANGDPINLDDPTGHRPVCDNNDCGIGRSTPNIPEQQLLDSQAVGDCNDGAYGLTNCNSTPVGTLVVEDQVANQYLADTGKSLPANFWGETRAQQFVYASSKVNLYNVGPTEGGYTFGDALTAGYQGGVNGLAGEVDGITNVVTFGHGTDIGPVYTNANALVGYQIGKGAGTIGGGLAVAATGEAAATALGDAWDIATAETDVAETDTGAGAVCGGMSFSAATPVLLADSTAKPISELHVGDKVLATNPTTGKTRAESVSAVLVHNDTDLYNLTVQSGRSTSTIHTTTNHLFWDQTTHTWTEAAKLHRGDRLKTPDQTPATVVGGATPAVASQVMWDLTVTAYHDFYIDTAAAPILVHNCEGARFVVDSSGVVTDTGTTNLAPETGSLDLPTSETWGRPNTLAGHFADHGADFRAASADEYAQEASNLFQRALQDELPTKIDPKTGIIRAYDPGTNTFGSFNANGTTRTFFSPDPGVHGFPTNWDYWVSQPGYSPWGP